MRLSIDQVWGRLGIEQSRPFLRLDVKNPSLRLEIEHPVLKVKPGRVELKIDSRECRADLQMYDPEEFARVYAARAKRRVLEHIADTASQGDRLAAVESGERDAIAAIAWENSFDPELSVELVPAHLPKIEFRVISGEREFQEGRVLVQLEKGEVRGRLEAGVVRGYLRRAPELHIRAVGSLLDTFA